jgi:hypothetical protein
MILFIKFQNTVDMVLSIIIDLLIYLLSIVLFWDNFTVINSFYSYILKLDSDIFLGPVGRTEIFHAAPEREVDGNIRCPVPSSVKKK